MILNFKNIPLSLKKENILEFILWIIYFLSNWMIDDYYKLIKSIKGYDNLSNFRFYDWVNRTSKTKVVSIYNIIDNFIKSDDIYMKNSNLFINSSK